MPENRTVLLVAGTAVLACLIGVAAGLAVHSLGERRLGTAPALQKAEWSSYGYEPVGRLPGRKYNVRMGLKRNEGDFRLRLVLCQQDEKNYDFVEFTPSETGIGRVEQGFEQRIGRSGASVLGAETAAQILVRRRDVDIAVYAGDALIASAWDSRFHGGRVLLGQVGGGVSVELFQVQPVSDVFFADDFMKAATEQGAWEPLSGSWQVETLKNPALSSNAFFYVGKGDKDPAVTTAGHWFWDDYRFQVACKPLGQGAVGILAYHRAPGDAYLFRLRDASEPGMSHRQLVKRCSGQETLLAEAGGGYTQGQWYKLGLAVQGDQITATIDGNTVLTQRDPSFKCGKVGLCTEGAGAANFDDAYVVSEHRFQDDFAAPATGRWEEFGGNWRVEKDASGNGRMVVEATGQGRAITGSDHWDDYCVSARLPDWQKGDVGLCAHYQDEGHYYLFRWSPGLRTAKLLAVVGGASTLLDQAPLPDPVSFPCEIALDLTNGLVSGLVNGQGVVRAASNAALSRGRAGLFAEDSAAAFDDFVMTFPKPDEPVLTLNEVFAGEKSMAEWSMSESDWTVRQERGTGASVTHSYWHRADFPGDVEMETILPGKGEESAAFSSFGLTVGADEESVGSGYRLMVEGEPASATLFRLEQAVERLDLPSGVPGTVSLTRRGQFILVHADGKRILAHRDSQPLTGTRVAFSTAAEKFDTSHLKVYSPNVYTYNFQKAPDEWREAGGTWHVTNRWQCDPRWSFFCGQSGQLAAIWNKRQFHGDLTLEFSAGIKMDAARGHNYEYASDVNATICADGKDLRTGYSFLFGGQGNSGTQIVRQGKVVAESPFRIPRGIHRHWFYVKIRKCGGRLSFWIDKSLILEYTDSEPLEGPYVALWTHNNGLMVTRVRISSESGQTLELPNPAFPRVAKCFYDN